MQLIVVENLCIGVIKMTQSKQQQIENFQRLIEDQFRVFTEETGIVIDDIGIFWERHNDEVFYNIEIEEL